MNENIGFEDWEFQLKSEADELRRLLALVERGTERHEGIGVQIYVLENRLSPKSHELQAYSHNYEVYACALDAARWAYDTKDVYPPPAAAWREAIEGEGV